MERRGRARRAFASAATVLALAACTPSPGTDSSSPGGGGGARGATATRTGVPGSTGVAGAQSPADVAPEEWAATRERSVTTLLRTRYTAADRSDRAGWLAALGRTPDAGLQRAQAAVFDRMTRMGASSFSITALQETSPPVPAPRGTPVEWDVKASLTYRLRGFDTEPRSFDLDLTFKADPGSPDRLVLSGSSPSLRPQPWDLDGLVVRRSPSSLVLAVGSASLVDEVVARARTAASRVAAVWGTARPAVWVAPATDADAAALLGRTSDGLGEVAAATDGPLTPGQPAGADRIVLVPGAWRALQPAGRDVVMTHELTHVTVRASTTRSVPLWLSEGFAELVAYAPIDLPEATVVAPALQQVRASGLPQALPAESDFDPGTGSLPAAYGLSLLALRTLADAQGMQGVVRLYRAAAGGLDVSTTQLGDGEAVVDDALASVLHTTRAGLVASWQQRIRRLLR